MRNGVARSLFKCTNFLPIFAQNAHIFRIFSNVFERFYFAWLAQSLQPNPLTLVFNPKTRIAPEKIPPISPFFL